MCVIEKNIYVSPHIQGYKSVCDINTIPDYTFHIGIGRRYHTVSKHTHKHTTYWFVYIYTIESWKCSSCFSRPQYCGIACLMTHRILCIPHIYRHILPAFYPQDDQDQQFSIRLCMYFVRDFYLYPPYFIRATFDATVYCSSVTLMSALGDDVII